MQLRIRWIGQSGYLISDGKTELCIDPYLSNVVDRVAKRGRMVEAPFTPDKLKSDAVICTHDHLDHVDIDAIPLMNKDMLFLAPSHAEPTLRSCGVVRYEPFDLGMSKRIGAFELLAVYANHSVPAVGLILRHEGLTFYFSGDTEYDAELEKLKSFDIDVMFICINGKLGNMNVDDAARLTRILSPRVGIPTHYGMFESNTEDPQEYVSRVPSSYVLEYNKEYDVKEILDRV
ncbi:MAG: MBL fold metallo-hydrolase [Clostridia bacterium]|nr:MBL fold metallo-hydrolase [Clostridia bacterium]